MDRSRLANIASQAKFLCWPPRCRCRSRLLQQRRDSGMRAGWYHSDALKSRWPRARRQMALWDGRPHRASLRRFNARVYEYTPSWASCRCRTNAASIRADVRSDFPVCNSAVMRSIAPSAKAMRLLILMWSRASRRWT